MTRRTKADTEPRVTQWADQHYAGITARVTMQSIGDVADRLPEVLARLADAGLEPAAAPFLRYHVIDMDTELEVEVGVPVDRPVPGTGPVRPGVLPAGRYVTVTHVGHPDELVAVTASLLAWAEREGLELDVERTERGERWGARVELWHSGPEGSDATSSVTELAFRLA